jgi:hypothetical protein
MRVWGRFMEHNRSAILTDSLVALVVLAAVFACAQEPEKPPEGLNSGNYSIKQTIEFGYRFVRDEDFKDPRGTRDVYNTFVNLDKGVRLFEHTLEMRSLNHQGWLFDNFYVSSFGYGGDPNDVTRLRMYKNKWYNFSGAFRRDRNFWNYNLLVNPLNPNTPIANAPPGFSPIVVFSPHRFETTRRLSDFNLTMLPQARVRFRLGYSRNISEGPSFSSFHEGTDVLLFQGWKTTLNSYQFGVDFKWLPRTNISYDQFFYYYKGDTSWLDRNQTFALPNGTLVDLGLPFNSAANQPCAVPFFAGGVVNPGCNGYLAYTRQGRVRTNYPTEQLSFQSNYFNKVDLSSRFVYSSSENNIFGFNEDLNGLVTRTRMRDRNESGPATGRRVSVSTDFGATWHVTEKFRVVDMFRFANFRLPMQWLFMECSFFPGASASLLAPPLLFTANASVPVTCPTPVNGVAGTPTHNASSPPDIAVGASSLFFKQDLKNNLFELQYDFTRRFGGRLGYRFRHRMFFESDFESGTFVFFPSLQNGRTLPAPFNVDENGKPVFCPPANNRADGSCLITPEPEFDSKPTEINEHSAVLGIWARPTDALRLSFDLELMSADSSFNRISPRQLQLYKTRATYKPMSWASLGASVIILENRNNVFQVNNKQHNRAYGFSVMVEPNEKWGFELGYDYNDVFSTTFICYPVSPNTAGLPPCIAGLGLFGDTSIYKNRAHYGYFNLTLKPIKRLTTNVGYAITSTAGSTLIINPNAPLGPLAYNYHRPYAGFALDLYKGLSWKGSWAYYGYNEKEQLVPVDSTGPRDFRGNMVTIAIRYAF